MRNIRISLKLLVSFLIVVVFAIAVGGVGIYGMYSISEADERMYSENLVALSTLGDIRETFQRQRLSLREFVLYAGNEPKIRQIQSNVAVLEREIEELFVVYEAAIDETSSQNAYLYAKNTYLNDFDSVKNNILQESIIGFEEGYRALNDGGNTAIIQAVEDGFSESMLENDNLALDRVQSNHNIYVSMRTIQIIVLACTVAIAVFFALYISSLISKPLSVLTGFLNRASSTGDLSLSQNDVSVIEQMTNVKDEIGQCIGSAAGFVGRITSISQNMESIAEGDLTIEVNLLSDLDVMGKSTKQMIDNLNTMFGEINSSSKQVSSGSKQIADGAQSLAQGSTEQAASVEQLSSSISEIAQQTRDNAEKAGKAANLARTIMSSAEKGSLQMDEMIMAVKEINDASQSIGKIIKTIDDIAFQTNILALNAAVEAARAGQHGKGFAVVAEEVRNLAAKSAEAAKDTGSMIQNSMEKAELGSQIAGSTATSLTEIVAGISESNRIIEDIATSSEEQSHGIAQVNIGIDQVAQVVAQNSATAEQSAAASQQLSGQSDVLQGLISQFKLKNQGLKAYGFGAPKQLAAHASPPEHIAFEGGRIGDFGKY